MIKKITNILTGWGKAFGILQTSNAEAKLSQLRLSICDLCEYAEGSKVLKIINDKDEEVYSLKCTKCKCPCLEKSLVVDEKCPLSKW